MSKTLITMNEDAGSARSAVFGVTYKVDEHDCLSCSTALKARGHEVFFVNWNDLRGLQFGRMFSYNATRFVEPVPLEEMDLIWIYFSYPCNPWRYTAQRIVAFDEGGNRHGMTNHEIGRCRRAFCKCSAAS